MTYPDHNRFTSRMRASVKECLLRHGVTLAEYNGSGPNLPSRIARDGATKRARLSTECERCHRKATTTVNNWRVCEVCAPGMIAGRVIA